MKAKKVIFYCLAGLAAGCVPIVSLNPLFTKETIVFDEKLLGTWLEDSNDPGRSWAWEFARFEESAAQGLPEDLQSDFKRVYRLNLTHKGDPQVQWAAAACLVKLGERRFLDIFSDHFPSGESDPEKMYNALFCLRSHSFLRVDAIGDKLKIAITRDENFKKLVEAEPRAVAYTLTERGPVLTASTRDLQAFVTRYADDERLFLPVTLVRKSQ
jgi:hypothetical protein